MSVGIEVIGVDIRFREFIHILCLSAIVLSTGVTNVKVRFIDFGDPSNVDSNSIRQLAKKYCTTTPYAYRCTFKNTQGILLL